MRMQWMRGIHLWLLRWEIRYAAPSATKRWPYLFKIVDFEFIIKKKNIRNITYGYDSKKYLIRSMFGFSLSKDILIDDLKYDEILIFF